MLKLISREKQSSMSPVLNYNELKYFPESLSLVRNKKKSIIPVFLNNQTTQNKKITKW